MTLSIADIVRESRACACVACGKCSAACSMASMYPDLSSACSPRGLVQAALRQAVGQGENVTTEYLWRCLQCGNCTAVCPERVDPAGLIAGLRENAIDAPERRSCRGCGREIPALPVQRWLSDTLDPDAASASFSEDGDEPRLTAYGDLCPICRRQVYAANNTTG